MFDFAWSEMAVIAVVALVAIGPKDMPVALKALTGLGVSALLVGAAGWAGIEIGGRYLNEALNGTTGDIRQIAEVIVRRAETDLHFWLNMTLIAGVALAGLGALLAITGGVLGSRRQG